MLRDPGQNTLETANNDLNQKQLPSLHPIFPLDSHDKSGDAEKGGEVRDCVDPIWQGGVAGVCFGNGSVECGQCNECYGEDGQPDGLIGATNARVE